MPVVTINGLKHHYVDEGSGAPIAIEHPERVKSLLLDGPIIAMTEAGDARSIATPAMEANYLRRSKRRTAVATVMTGWTW